MSAPGPGPDDAGSGGAGPADAAADVVKRPEPGTTGSAGPALPPGCRGILVLRALRLGALLAVVAVLGLAGRRAGGWWLAHTRKPTDGRGSPATMVTPRWFPGSALEIDIFVRGRR